MATAIRTVGHEERLSIVDHLEELRTRLIVSGVAFAIVFGLCFWQNHALLKFINRPLHKQTEQQVLRGEGPAGATWLAQKGVLEVAKDTQGALGALSSPSSGLPAATRGRLAGTIGKLEADVARIPREPSGIDPTTLGPGEPLTATLTVTLYFSLVIALPLILFELYGFLMPAFSPQERRVVMPLLVSVPFLFATGAAFGYFVVLPTAVHFLQNFNANQFNVMVQANLYYKFAATVLLAMGLAFQAPVVILGAVRAGLVTPSQLRRHRRYALLLCAAVAAFLPGDAFTLVLETVPLYLLYEASILIASVAARRETARATAAGAGDPPQSPPPSAGSSGAPDPSPPSSQNPGGPQALATADPSTTTAQEMIDHIDPELSN
ncbi:MAG TPA: twin-arginine translocase subunit TatC [Solirubrobacteraceae bacterium]